MSIMVKAPSTSMAAEAGTETEYGFIITSEKLENTCVSHGKSLKSKYAIGRATKQLTALESQNSGKDMPIFLM